MTTKKMLLALFVGGALALPAAAQDTTITETDRVEYNKKTLIDFSDVTIEGELTKPEGSYIVNRKVSKFSRLITVRENFVPELKVSADDI